jgi:hypothetical protein
LALWGLESETTTPLPPYVCHWCSVSSNNDLHKFYLNKSACEKYAPITSVNVEFLFSMYKNILIDNRDVSQLKI